MIADLSHTPVSTRKIWINFKNLVEITYCSLMILTAAIIPTPAVEVCSQ
jgi:hypothetical protein